MQPSKHPSLSSTCVSHCVASFLTSPWFANFSSSGCKAIHLCSFSFLPHSSLSFLLRWSCILPSVFYFALLWSNLSCTNTPEVFNLANCPFERGPRIHPSVHPSAIETLNRKPLETPQTGGCGIGRGLDKRGKLRAFHYSKVTTLYGRQWVFCNICKSVGWHFWQPAPDVFVCLWQPLAGIGFKVEGGILAVVMCSHVNKFGGKG